MNKIYFEKTTNKTQSNESHFFFQNVLIQNQYKQSLIDFLPKFFFETEITKEFIHKAGGLYKAVNMMTS